MQKPDTKKAKVESASLIDLKAELFRKQEEFKGQKLQNQHTGFIRGKASSLVKKPSLFSKKNAGVIQRSEKDYEEKIEEENVFERSRKALESKAKLYEKISTGTDISEEDGSGLYLVDFQKKSLDDFEERRDRERKEKEEMERREVEEEQRQLSEPVPPPETDDDDWVDYVDAFGRSRRCLKKDLSDLIRQDESLQEKKRKIDGKIDRGYKDFQVLRDKCGDVPSLMSSDMKREIDRQKWEKEEMEKMPEEKQGPIHYADLQHNEIRNHGVGFYKFDTEESVRQEQMDQLHKLRQQTKDERSKSDRIKEKRKTALAARLAKVKQRKREKLGLPEPDEDENASSGEEIGPTLAEQTKAEPEPLTRDDSLRASGTSTREWDKGKHLTMERSEQAWLETQRAEREEEFAPPTFYNDDTPSTKYSNVKGKMTKKRIHETKHNTGSNQSVQPMVKKQVNQIRMNVDFDTSGTSDLNATQMRNITKIDSCADDTSDTSTKIQDTIFSNNVQSGFNEPFHNIPQQHANLSAPPPNINVPPPQFNVPPPQFNNPPTNFNDMPIQFSDPPPQFNNPTPQMNTLPPQFNMPPPSYHNPPPSFSVSFNVVPPNVNIPPPNFNQALSVPTDSTGQLTAVANSTSSSAAVQTVSVSAGVGAVISTTNQLGQSSAVPMEEVGRKKFVPKLDILDTRHIANENM